MFYTLLAWTIIVICLLAIGAIVWRHWPQAKIIDVNTIVEEKELRVKERLLLDRWQRQVKSGKKVLARSLNPVKKVGLGFWSQLWQKLITLEKKYQKQSAVTANDSAEQAEQIKLLLTEANDLLKQEEYSASEKKFIELIGLSPMNTEAYEGLADIYMAQKEWNQALQTLNYLIKLNKKLSRVEIKEDQSGNKVKTYSLSQLLMDNYRQLGNVYEAQSNWSQAFASYEQALQFTPNNPKILDLLINSAIILHNKRAAQVYCDKLREVNPDNQKLGEYKKMILALS